MYLTFIFKYTRIIHKKKHCPTKKNTSGQWRPGYTLIGWLNKKGPLHLGNIRKTWSLEYSKIIILYKMLFIYIFSGNMFPGFIDKLDSTSPIIFYKCWALLKKVVGTSATLGRLGSSRDHQHWIIVDPYLNASGVLPLGILRRS